MRLIIFKQLTLIAKVISFDSKRNAIENLLCLYEYKIDGIHIENSSLPTSNQNKQYVRLRLGFQIFVVYFSNKTNNNCIFSENNCEYEALLFYWSQTNKAINRLKIAAFQFYLLSFVLHWIPDKIFRII